jgi:hypothetical protein
VDQRRTNKRPVSHSYYDSKWKSYFFHLRYAHHMFG